MIVVRDFDRLKGKELVATIGFFDGVHLGHRFLIDEMKEIAKARNLPSAVITFPEHPRAVLHAEYQPKQIIASYWILRSSYPGSRPRNSLPLF